jgi:GGDEF domain-containing protein
MIVRDAGRQIIFGNFELSIHASIGIAIFPSDGHDADSLLKTADEDMHRAKIERKRGNQAKLSYGLQEAGGLRPCGIK